MLGLIRSRLFAWDVSTCWGNANQPTYHVAKKKVWKRARKFDLWTGLHPEAINCSDIVAQLQKRSPKLSCWGQLCLSCISNLCKWQKHMLPPCLKPLSALSFDKAQQVLQHADGFDDILGSLGVQESRTMAGPQSTPQVSESVGAWYPTCRTIDARPS